MTKRVTKAYIVNRLNSAIRSLAKQKRVSQDYEWSFINLYGLDDALNNLKELKQLLGNKG